VVEVKLREGAGWRLLGRSCRSTGDMRRSATCKLPAAQLQTATSGSFSFR